MTDDPLEALRARINETRDAAARFAEEAAGARADSEAGRVPPQGWATTGEQSERTEELRALVVLLESVRDLIPEDLREQFRELVRQLLLLLRALIDWWVARMEPQPIGSASRGAASARRGPAVQDIPVT